MNFFAFFEASFCVRLTKTLAHFLWQGIVIAFLAVLAGVLLRRSSSRVQYGVYVVALLLMAASPPATFWIVGGSSAPELGDTQGPVALRVEPSRSHVPEAAKILPPSGHNVMPEATEVPKPVSAQSRPNALPAETGRTSDWQSYAPYAAACYLIGVIIMLGRLLAALQGGKRLRRRAQPVNDPAILAAVGRWAKALGLPVAPVIAYCPRVAVPTVVGVLRPMILLPLSLASGLSPEQVEMSLLHELAHIRRYDHLVNIVQGIIEAVLFFHPAVWFVSRRIRIERENCCDDMVVAVGGKPMTYASSLVEMAALSRRSGSPRLAPAVLGAVRQPSQLRRRVLRLLGDRAHERVRLKRGWSVALAIAAVVALGAAASLQSEEKETKTAAPNPTRRPYSVKAKFELDTDIPVRLVVGTKEEPDLLRFAWIRFSLARDQLQADLRFVEVTKAAAKWSVHVQLLDKKGRVLSEAEGVYATQRLFKGVAVWSEGELHFELGDRANARDAVQFAVSVAQVSGDATVTLERKSVAPPAVKPEKGESSLEVSVVGVDGQPPQRFSLIVWRQIDPAEMRTERSAFQEELYWHDKVTGKVWMQLRSIAARSTATAENLPPGDYRVTACSGWGDDPTPVGISPMIRLDGSKKKESVSIRLKGDSPLLVKVMDPAGGRPVSGEFVLLRREDGMPVAHTSNWSRRYVDASGTVHYSHLAPGIYSLEVGKSGWWFGMYHPESSLVRTRLEVVEGKENVVEVLMHSTGPEAKRSPSPATSGAAEPKANSHVEGKFEHHREIPLELRAGKQIIGERDYFAVELESVRFLRSRDEIQASVRVRTASIVQAKWGVEVELLSHDGRVLGDSEVVLETFLRILGRPGLAEGYVHFSLGRWSEVSQASKFRVSIERAPDDAKVTARLTSEAKPPRKEDVSPPERLVFRGLDLIAAPCTTRSEDLPDLFEERPPGSKSYHLRGDIVRVQEPAVVPCGEVFYIPRKKVFYVQYDPLGSSTLHYYGPFKGDPFEQLGIPKDARVPARPTAEADVAWGEAVNALRAGIIFELGERPYHVGESVSLVFKLRNVSSDTIHLAYTEPVFLGWKPVVIDASGRKVPVWGPVYNILAQGVRRSLAAGETIVLGNPMFTILPPGWEGEIKDIIVYAAPGKYRVSQPYRFQASEPNDWSGELRSGWLELEIIPPEPDRQSVSLEKAPEFGKDIPIDLNIGKTPSGYAVKARSVRFERDADMIRASVEVHRLTVLNAKWRVRLGLLSTEAQVLKQTEIVFATSRIIKGVAKLFKTHLHFPPIQGIDVSKVAEFRLIIERAPDDAKVTAEMVPRPGPVESGDAPPEKAQPFTVTGTVTDGGGRPMPDVEVWASAGKGSLLPTGKAISGRDGKHTLRFGPGYGSLDKESGEWDFPWQLAVVGAQKPGYYEKNLSQRGSLSIAADPQSVPEGRPEPVVLPNQPYQLDFVMLPAATIKGRVVDIEGRPVAGQRFVVDGDELPPAASVLRNVTTDEQGRFTVSEVPCKTYWFALVAGRSREIKTDSVEFSQPGTYEIELTYDADKPSLEVKANHSLEVRVVDSEGRPAGLVMIQLWSPEDSEEKPGRDKRGWQEPTLWHDEASGRSWVPDGLHQVRDSTVFEKLLPGEYRVSVAKVRREGGSDPSPVGVSDVIRLSTNKKTAAVTMRLEGETPLTLKFFDVDDKKPLENADFVLLRSDGFPIGHGRAFSGEDGTFRFGGLTPGAYWLKAGKRAWLYGQTEYEIPEGSMRIEIVRGKNNVVEVPLQPIELTQAEVERRWPFVVTGNATDGEGRAMSGVEVRAHCGMGTLWQTGKTTSGPDGKYMLRFGPGMTSLDEESGKWVISWQFATVRAYKSGYCEKNLSRHGGLSIAGEPQFVPENPREPVVLPSKPYKLDFVMLPAATISGRLVDTKGGPVANQKVWLKGKELPPSQSVLAGAETDKDGRFTVGEVPCKSWWFEFRDKKGREVRSEPISITTPATYEIKLIYSSPSPGQPSLLYDEILVRKATK